MKKNKPPVLLIISQTMRRDLHAPLRNFKKFKVVHAYAQAGYKDMKKEEFSRPPSIRFESLKELREIIIKCRPSIIQTPEPWANKLSFMASGVVLNYVKKHKIKLVMPVFENIKLSRKLSFFKNALVKSFFKKIDQYVAVYFALNSGAKANLKDLGVSNSKISNIMWASWGINLEEFKPPSGGTQGAQDKILFLGRVSRAKGILLLMKAFELVKKEIPAAKLVVAGLLGDAEEYIKRDGVEFLGALKNVEVPKFFQRGGVCAMPSQTTDSWAEQVGMVGLQALACGVPVVTTNSGAIPEYFKPQSGAYIVGEKDYLKLSEKLILLLKSKREYRSASKKAVRYIRANFDCAKTVAKAENLLLELVDA